MNTPEQSVQDLALALGMWIDATPVQRECFIESVVVLAHAAGVSKEIATESFWPYEQQAIRVWEEIAGEQ